MFILYNFLMTILAPIWVPWMLLKAKRRKEQPNWKERQGDYPLTPRKDGERIWIHAVSVGEVVAVVPILRELRQLLPDHEIVLSVTTSSGHQTARELQNPLSRPGGEGAGG
ncbi:MAG: glycosyltransferase N-terminal domain-containing protein, partial [Fimbriimonadaceae bacterium]